MYVCIQGCTCVCMCMCIHTYICNYIYKSYLNYLSLKLKLHAKIFFSFVLHSLAETPIMLMLDLLCLSLSSILDKTFRCKPMAEAKLTLAQIKGMTVEGHWSTSCISWECIKSSWASGITRTTDLNAITTRSVYLKQDCFSHLLFCFYMLT